MACTDYADVILKLLSLDARVLKRYILRCKVGHVDDSDIGRFWCIFTPALFINVLARCNFDLQ